MLPPLPPDALHVMMRGAVPLGLFNEADGEVQDAGHCGVVNCEEVPYTDDDPLQLVTP